MSCPTCGHTIHCLGTIEGRTHFHCPRCGTQRIHCGYGDDFEPVYHDTVPKLVARCRMFEVRSLIAGEATVEAVSLWFRLGIPESINLPADRIVVS